MTVFVTYMLMALYAIIQTNSFMKMEKLKYMRDESSYFWYCFVKQSVGLLGTIGGIFIFN